MNLPAGIRPLVRHVENATVRRFVFGFQHIVERYSNLRITKRSNRLTALSGFWKRIRYVRDEYAAGLWRESIVSDLLWRAERLNVESIEPLLEEEYCGRHDRGYRSLTPTSPVAYWMDIVIFHDPARLSPAPTVA